MVPRPQGLKPPLWVLCSLGILIFVGGFIVILIRVMWLLCLALCLHAFVCLVEVLSAYVCVGILFVLFVGALDSAVLPTPTLLSSLLSSPLSPLPFSPSFPPSPQLPGQSGQNRWQTLCAYSSGHSQDKSQVHWHRGVWVWVQKSPLQVGGCEGVCVRVCVWGCVWGCVYICGINKRQYRWVFVCGNVVKSNIFLATGICGRHCSNALHPLLATCSIGACRAVWVPRQDLALRIWCSIAGSIFCHYTVCYT